MYIINYTGQIQKINDNLIKYYKLNNKQFIYELYGSKENIHNQLEKLNNINIVKEKILSYM